MAKWLVKGVTSRYYICSKCRGGGDPHDRICPHCHAIMFKLDPIRSLRRSR